MTGKDRNRKEMKESKNKIKVERMDGTKREWKPSSRATAALRG
jgi:hypothetical protein